MTMKRLAILAGLMLVATLASALSHVGYHAAPTVSALWQGELAAVLLAGGAALVMVGRCPSHAQGLLGVGLYALALGALFRTLSLVWGPHDSAFRGLQSVGELLIMVGLALAVASVLLLAGWSRGRALTSGGAVLLVCAWPWMGWGLSAALAGAGAGGGLVPLLPASTDDVLTPPLSSSAGLPTLVRTLGLLSLVIGVIRLWAVVARPLALAGAGVALSAELLLLRGPEDFARQGSGVALYGVPILVMSGLIALGLLMLARSGSRVPAPGAAARPRPGQARRAHDVFGFGRSHATLYTQDRPTTTFADVAGVTAAKADLQEEVAFLRDPAQYQCLGARLPTGVLLVGPPGTGKTLLARAVAGEAGVPFFSLSATEFVELFVGVGASRVRDLFEQARAVAPCIIFIDEIDAIGRQRGSAGHLSLGANDEREQTLNQLLVCLDGFEPHDAVIVLAATNRPDVLDPALLRPGRFDRQVTVDLPDRRGREAILQLHTQAVPLAPEVTLATVAAATPGMSGADLANLANEAALSAARRRARCLTMADFEVALDRLTLGAPGAALLSAEERRTTAYHEAGHALVASLLPHGDPVHRVTIMPHGRGLGVTQFRATEDRHLYRRDYLLNRLAIGWGGRVAEELACEVITSGAHNDLQEITRVARAMVTQLGMVEDLEAAYGEPASASGLPGAGDQWEEPHTYSEATAQRIDAAVLALLAEGHARARTLLSTHRTTLDAIAAALLADEVLERERLAALIAAHAQTTEQAE